MAMKVSMKVSIGQTVASSTSRNCAVQFRGGCNHRPMVFVQQRHGLSSKREHVAKISSLISNNAGEGIMEPDDARAAIAVGLSLTEKKEWQQAQAYFERALELPGTGVKRFRDKPRLISDGEKIAALYNIACCQSQLAALASDGEEAKSCIHNGLVALAGCLEAGYDDFRQVRSDADLEMLRTSDKFDGLLRRFERSGGFMNIFKK